jgi:hypothetical protein
MEASLRRMLEAQSTKELTPQDGGHRNTRPQLRTLVERLTQTPAIPAVIAGVLGVLTIGSKSIWNDEAFAVAMGHLPTVDLLVYLWRNEMTGSPHTLLLHAWLWLGDGEAQVRLLSVVFGVIAVLATYAVGRRFGVGFSAALLLAVFPFFIQYEQEARGYTMLAAWTSISTLAYLRLREQPSRLRAGVYIFAAVAAIYVQPFAGVVVGAHALATLLWAPPDIRKRLLVVYIPVVVGWLPMLRWILLNRDKLYWIPDLTPGLAVDYLVALSGGLILAVVVGVLLIVGARRDVVTLWLLAPVTAAIVLSILVTPVVYPRYLIGMLPAAAIIVARNRPVLVASVVALSLVGVVSWYVDGQKDDWRSGAAWVSAQVQPTDGMVFLPHWDRVPFAYYATVGEPLYPSTPWTDRYMPAMGLHIDIPAGADNPRIWLFKEHADSVAPPDVGAILSVYSTFETRQIGLDGPYISLLVRH